MFYKHFTVVGLLVALAPCARGAETLVFDVNFESAAYTIGVQPNLDTVHVPNLDWNTQHVGLTANAPVAATAMGANGGTKSLLLDDGGGPAVIGEIAGLAALNNSLGSVKGRMLMDVRGTVDTATDVFTFIRLNADLPNLLTVNSFQFGQVNGRFQTFGALGANFIGTAVPVKDTTYRYEVDWDMSGPLDFFRVLSIKANPGGVETELLPLGLVSFSGVVGAGIKGICVNTNANRDSQVDNIKIFDNPLPAAVRSAAWMMYD